MRVSLAQVAAGRDVAACRALVREAAGRAAADGADLVVLPEYASYFDPRGVDASAAEDVDGPFVTAAREAAQAAGVAVVTGVTLRGPDGDARASNGVVLVDARGDVRGVYRKVHLYDAFGERESERFVAGPAEPPPTMLVDDVQVGVMTCYDLRFPESARRLVDAGADVLLCPAAWAAGPGKVEQWTLLARARALENTSFVVAVGMAGRGVCGSSLVAGPDGEVRRRLGLTPEQVTVEILAADVARTRERNPSLVNRRFAVVPRHAPGG